MQLSVVLLCAALGAEVRRARAETSPLAKVVELLDSLAAKVSQDGAVEDKQYRRFTEWCEDEATSRKYEIENAQAKAETLAAAIEKEASNIGVASATIEELGAEVTQNQKDLDAATEIRKREKADFEAKDAELAQTIDEIGRAIGILERALKAPSLLQNAPHAQDVIDALQAVLQAQSVDNDDSTQLSALLQSSDDDDFLAQSAPDAKAYESHSGKILETLDDMKEKAVELRHEGQKAEMNAQHAYEMLAQSLKDELKTDGADFDAAKAAKSAAAEAKATAEGDLAMSQKVASEAQAFLQHVTQECQQKASDVAESAAARAAELKTLAEAKRVLEQSTGAAAGRTYGFVQGTFAARAAAADPAAAAAQLITQLGQRTRDAGLSQLGMRIRDAVQMSAPAEDVFAKVRSMIEEMIAKLMSQAAEEADHKAWCDKEMGSTQGKVEGHEAKLDKLSSKIDAAEAAIAQLSESIQRNQEALATLAKQQAEMTAIRTAEKEAYEASVKDMEAGITGLGQALSVLREYYATAAEPPALVQAAHKQPAVDTHTPGDASGIIGLLEVAESDFTKMLSNTKVAEESASKAYAEAMHEMDVDKAMKDADIKYESKEKTGTETLLNDLKVDKEGEQSELDAVGEYYKRLAPACTTKPLSYDERKQRRESEIAGLRDALVILEGQVGPNEAAFLQKVRPA